MVAHTGMQIEEHLNSLETVKMKCNISVVRTYIMWDFLLRKIDAGHIVSGFLIWSPNSMTFIICNLI